MTVRCRCRNCEGRRTLARHPLEYERVPPCQKCGATEKSQLEKYGGSIPPRLMGESLVWRVAKRDIELKSRKLCRKECLVNTQTGSMYPHRWGSPGCIHREDFVIDASTRGTLKHEAGQDEPCGF